ncbi:uncharacterized protein CELE_F10C1.1 [Caenorhabditis elegans]|uniref:Uncharacterized protein n=1 Tax=Caenorhabditis elegans TaxID=6239 RepID=Q19292_CAEEL|nr:Uncharacterized protein CELE_F10C1.1 [Caenorhabditis elegans]CCD65028.1 Uncharacterized protein CELE_F10C1.1 [Caenorhabditis elegans]|eukprot:NP_495139.1 Uncharacterized protein CELE_F10C1.1 [Caenorhabditis elegans]
MVPKRNAQVPPLLLFDQCSRGPPTGRSSTLCEEGVGERGVTVGSNETDISRDSSRRKRKNKRL